MYAVNDEVLCSGWTNLEPLCRLSMRRDKSSGHLPALKGLKTIGIRPVWLPCRNGCLRLSFRLNDRLIPAVKGNSNLRRELTQIMIGHLQR